MARPRARQARRIPRQIEEEEQQPQQQEQQQEQPQEVPEGINEGMEFIVERIVGRRDIGNGLEYLIQWEGINPDNGRPWLMTWEPERNVDNADQCLAAFMQHLAPYEVWIPRVLELDERLRIKSIQRNQYLPQHSEIVITRDIPYQVAPRRAMVYNYILRLDANGSFNYTLDYIRFRKGFNSRIFRTYCPPV